MIKVSTLAIALAFASSAAFAQSADPTANSPSTVTNGAAANAAVAPMPETSLPAAADSTPMPEVAAAPAATADAAATTAATTAPAATTAETAVAAAPAEAAPAAAASTQVAATTDYPVCTRTVVDKCINRGASKNRPG